MCKLVFNCTTNTLPTRPFFFWSKSIGQHEARTIRRNPRQIGRSGCNGFFDMDAATSGTASHRSWKMAQQQKTKTVRISGLHSLSAQIIRVSDKWDDQQMNPIFSIKSLLKWNLFNSKHFFPWMLLFLGILVKRIWRIFRSKRVIVMLVSNWLIWLRAIRFTDKWKWNFSNTWMNLQHGEFFHHFSLRVNSFYIMIWLVSDVIGATHLVLGVFFSEKLNSMHFRICLKFNW